MINLNIIKKSKSLIASKISLLKIYSFLLLFILLAQNIYGSRIDELMAQGNEAYQNENFDEAVNSYESILNEGFVSAALYYNLGNSYYRLNNIGKSILNFERALKLDPNFENAEYNLQIVRARTIDKIKSVPELFIFQWWNTIITILSPSIWALLVSLIFISWLIVLLIWFWTKSFQLKQTLFFVGVADFSILILLAVLLVSSIRYENKDEYGILLKSTVTVKASPNDKSEDAFIIHEGVKFAIIDELQDWSEIKLDDGKIGWLPKNSFEEI